MRLLVAGCGSIGERHAANAAPLAEVGVFDPQPERVRSVTESCGATGFDSLASALEWRPSAVVVATPHHLHLEVATAAVEAGCHALIEKPISHSESGVANFLSLARALGRQVWVVCNMRFHPGPATLARALPEIGSALFARAHFGNYLPSMRPEADYRELYCARASSGGGVILDAIHEIDYLTWLLGPAVDVICSADRLSDLDIDVEDYASIDLTHACGARSEVHLDYLQQFKRRGCEIVGTEGTLIWDSTGKTPERCTVRLFTRGAGRWTTLTEIESVDGNEPYVEVIQRFLGSLSEDTDKGLLDGATAAAELDVVLEAKRFAVKGRQQSLKRTQSAH